MLKVKLLFRATRKKTQHKADAEFPTAVKQLIALMYVRFLAFGYQV